MAKPRTNSPGGGFPRSWLSRMYGRHSSTRMENAWGTNCIHMNFLAAGTTYVLPMYERVPASDG